MDYPLLPHAPKGTWVHWVVWNIPTTVTDLKTTTNYQQGLNSWKKNSYGGPCPPPEDDAHRYYFKLYALNTILDLPKNTDKQKLEEAMKNHILGKAILMGKYKRK